MILLMNLRKRGRGTFEHLSSNAANSKLGRSEKESDHQKQWIYIAIKRYQLSLWGGGGEMNCKH